MTSSIDLYVAVLTLRPVREGALLPHSGRAVQAWWLNYLQQRDAALARRLHDADTRRPYACSGLLGMSTLAPGTLAPISTERTYQLRIASWDAPTVERLLALVAAPPPALTLGNVPFAVETAAPDAETPPTTFAALAANYLLPPSADDARLTDVTLRFLTATLFRQATTPSGRPAPLPFPVPGSVWGGLFDRWQAAASVQLDATARDALVTRVAVSRFAGESQRLLVPGIGVPDRQVGATGGQWVVGFVGRCTYWWPKRDGYLGGVLRLLAAFAGYASVGYGTAYGLGQVRPAFSEDIVRGARDHTDTRLLQGSSTADQ